jgi:YegS/Rv2252/BmrU family lipid kinase
VTSIGVVAHNRKTVGGGLEELRAALADAGFADPPWEEVTKSKQAPKAVHRLVRGGADLLIVWGGDGTVQRCIDTLVGEGVAADVAIAVIPAGTANLLANGLGIPADVRAAVDIALHGARRPLDIGRVNGEHFAVMAGTGFDALMIRDADRGLKDRLGRAAYVWTGMRNLGNSAAQATVTVDGQEWFHGRATCVLLGNMGRLIGGLEAFPGATPDDGRLEVGVVQAETRAQWLRVMARAALGDGPSSPLVSTTRASDKVKIRLDRTLPWELDGGDRPRTDTFKVKVLHRALTICTPDRTNGAASSG